MNKPGRPRKDGTAVASQVKLVDCQYCGMKQRSGAIMNRHIMQRHPEAQLKHTCDLCKEKFATMNDMLNHCINHWEKDGPCPLCENSTKTFTRRATILVHLMQKHNLPEPYIPPVLKPHREGNKRYICEECKKEFSKPTQIIRHIRIHTGEQPFQCKICDKCFNQKSSLDLHMPMHSNRRLYKCHLCPYEVNQRGNLRSHLRKIHSAKPTRNRHYCPYCSSSFVKAGSLNVHCKRYHQNTDEVKTFDETVHDVMKGIECLNSQSRVDSDILQQALECSDISSNYKISPNVKPYNCTTCKKSFRDSSGLSLHQYNKHRIQNKPPPDLTEEFNTKQYDPLPASIDDLFSKDASKLDIDLSMLPLDDPSLYVTDILNVSDITQACEPFGTVSKDSELLSKNDSLLDFGNNQMSIDNILMNPDLFSKDEYNNYGDVPQTIDNAILLNQLPTNTDESIQTSADKPEFPLIPIINATIQSGDRYPINEFMLEPQIPTTSDDRDFELMKKSLNMHKSGFNFPPLNHRCEQCPASFKKPSDLVRHTRTHTGEKPFECDICKKRFSLKNVCKTHRRTHNADEKERVMCQVCGKDFASKASLQLHMRSHNMIRPFKCPVCNESFKTSGNRSSHLRVHFKANARKPKNYITKLMTLDENDIPS